PMIEGFYDMVREDVFALVLCVIGAVLAGSMPEDLRPRLLLGRWWIASEYVRWLRIAALSLVCTAVMYTRLPFVFIVVWIVLFVFFRSWRDGVLVVLGTATACALILLGMQYSSRGWYWMYTVSIMQNHRVIPTRFMIGLDLILRFAPFVAWL